MMTMAPGIEAAASPHGRAAAAAAAAAAAWYQQGGAYPEAPVVPPQMHHSVQDPAAVGHTGHAGHGPEAASFFASSDAASRYYQMHYESAASQGKPAFSLAWKFAYVLFNKVIKFAYKKVCFAYDIQLCLIISTLHNNFNFA